ncbi:MAG TPA: MOSC domain-containing protein [Myxococcales bacterium]|nr:MOSC domain-containing protein [Myxococcales bacterium]
MWQGRVEAIHICPQAAKPPVPVASVRAVRGRGLEGDRYFFGTGTYSTHPGSGREVTLIEAEALEALQRETGIALGSGATRRNIVTRGVPLNHLVGRRFRVGHVLLEGTRFCEPCAHLERLTEKGVVAGLVHRGGLRTVIVEEGTVALGDVVRPEDG